MNQLHQKVCAEYDQASKKLISLQKQESPNRDIIEQTQEYVRQKMQKIREVFNF